MAENVRVKRGGVVILLVLCGLCPVLRVAGCVTGVISHVDEHGLDRYVLPLGDWSMQRARIEDQLSARPGKQLVFVHYEKDDRSIFEWVYNRPDILGAKVVWARGFGRAKDTELRDVISPREVWRLDAGAPRANLVKYDLDSEVLTYR